MLFPLAAGAVPGLPGMPSIPSLSSGSDGKQTGPTFSGGSFNVGSSDKTIYLVGAVVLIAAVVYLQVRRK